VGSKAQDDDALIRQFINNFEYFFGGTDSDSDCLTEDEDGEKKPLLNRRKKESSIVSSISRPINSTFSYTSSDPSVFRPKLNFMTTRDVVAVMMKNSKDFLGSQARARSRILQRPEMWSKIVESSRSDDEYCTADYESMILQLMEFRLMYEYLNGGSGGQPFSNIRKAYPSSEELWSKKDKQLKEMEDGTSGTAQDAQSTEATNTESQTPVAALVSQPKRTKKQKMMEKIAAEQAAAAAAAATASSKPEEVPVSSSQSDSDTSEDADTLVMNHRRKRLGSSDSNHVVIPPVKAEPPVFTVNEEEANEDSDWIQVGQAAAPNPSHRTRKGSADLVGRTRKSSTSKAVPAPPVVASDKRKPLHQLSNAHKTHRFRLWVQSRPGSEYVCDSFSVKAVPKGTFIHIVSTVSGYSNPQVPIKECPF